MRNLNDVMLDSIEIIISKRLEKLINNDRQGVVTEITTDRLGKKKYTVLINGSGYKVTDGVNLNPIIGTKVWVHLPNGNWEGAYICAVI
ncbi:hypothetical protein [Kineothrix sp. MB12-C1]|uniref:hypothetical protein n=1 Tax=Kineothrix sp. MB12-C1 TaxID=3070215 RepID=UPI0027D334E7|nr:hypothetical protein [Kineothrix sp. MB12-C1]WMC93197.1 hypothetical protein RBB56_02625 [Kineothrix sp. MB12-C1]